MYRRLSPDSGGARGCRTTHQRPKTTSIPDSTSSSLGLGSFPVRSVRSALSSVTNCETLATDSFGSPVALAGSRTFPGALAHLRLLVRATHTPVAMRLRFSGSPWTTTTGRRNLARSPSPQAARPTRHRLGQSLPIAALQDPARRRPHELLCRVADLGECSVHRLGHTIGSVSGHVLREGSAIHLTSGAFHPPCQLFSFLEYVIRNRDRYFHTRSITTLCRRSSRARFTFNPR